MSLMRGGDRISSFRYEQLAKTAQGSLGLQAGTADVLPKVINVGLHVAELQRFDARDSDAGADIAHQVKDTGGIAHALARNGIVGDGCQGHKNQAQTRSLQHQRPPEIPEAYVQAEE